MTAISKHFHPREEILGRAHHRQRTYVDETPSVHVKVRVFVLGNRAPGDGMERRPHRSALNIGNGFKKGRLRLCDMRFQRASIAIGDVPAFFA